jgi:deoxyribonuclease-4
MAPMSKQPHKTAAVPLIGAHFSSAGGPHHALEEAREWQCPVAQLFTSSPRQWKPYKIAEESVAKFLELQKETGVLAVSHASYLINLAAEGEFQEKSASAFADELRRCQALNIPYLVIHPGSAGSRSMEDGITKIASSLDRAYAESENSATTVLLETTAGAGHVIGSRFEHLADIIGKASTAKRLGICVDTCHIFAAGYDIRTQDAYEKTIGALKKALPLSRLHFFHCNDSRAGFNSHVDRHAHLGDGQLGIEPFRFILNDDRFAKVGKCLETENDEKRVRDIQILRDAVAVK